LFHHNIRLFGGQTLVIYSNHINLLVLLFLAGGYHYTITQNIQFRGILIGNFLNLIELQDSMEVLVPPHARE